MPEVLVSSALLALVVVNTTSLYMNSGQTLRATSMRDAVNARIAEDLEVLRRESWEWACEAGTACTGLATDSDKPVRYKTARVSTALSSSPYGAPNQAYQQACGINPQDPTGPRLPQTTAALMQSEQRHDGQLVFPAGPVNLSWGSNPPPHANAITIQRTIRVDPNDGNQLLATYQTTSASPVNVAASSTLIPQALGWCP